MSFVNNPISHSQRATLRWQIDTHNPSRPKCIIKLILRKLPPRNLSLPRSVPSSRPVTPGRAPVLSPTQRALPPAKQRHNHKAAKLLKYRISEHIIYYSSLLMVYWDFLTLNFLRALNSRSFLMVRVMCRSRGVSPLIQGCCAAWAAVGLLAGSTCKSCSNNEHDQMIASGALNLVVYLNDQVLGTVRDFVPPGRAEFERPLHHLPADGQFARLVPERLEAAQPVQKIDFSVRATLGCTHIKSCSCIFSFLLGHSTVSADAREPIRIK